MHHPTDRILHTTAFVTPVVEHWLEREIAQWVHPMKDRSDDPSHHERTLLPRSYIAGLMCPSVVLSILFKEQDDVGQMVKDHSDSERGNPLPPYGLLFLISSKGSFICTIPQTG